MIKKLPALIFTIALVVIGVWLLGLIFDFAAWLISGLLYVAGVILIIGLIATFIRRHSSSKD